jgi:hypothetical protein
MKRERMRTSKEFLMMVPSHSMFMLDNFVTMDYFSVYFTNLRPSSSPNSGWRRACLSLSKPKSMTIGKSRWCWPSLILRASFTPTTYLLRGKKVNFPVHY